MTPFSCMNPGEDLLLQLQRRTLNSPHIHYTNFSYRPENAQFAYAFVAPDVNIEEKLVYETRITIPAVTLELPLTLVEDAGNKTVIYTLHEMKIDDTQWGGKLTFEVYDILQSS